MSMGRGVHVLQQRGSVYKVAILQVRSVDKLYDIQLGPYMSEHDSIG